METNHKRYTTIFLVFLLVTSCCFLTYSYLLNVSQKHLSSDYKEYKELIKEQDQKLASLQADNIKIKKSQEVLSQNFLAQHGFPVTDLNSISIQKEIDSFRQKQEDILQQVHIILMDQGFRKAFYENDDLLIFLGKYSDISSQTENNKLAPNLWESLNASHILNLILGDPIYHSFYQKNPTDSPDLKAGILHQVSLGYDLYKLSEINLKNLDDSRVAFDLYLDGVKSLQKRGYNVVDFNLSQLQSYQKQLEELYSQYLQYEGVLNQLEELKNNEEEK